MFLTFDVYISTLGRSLNRQDTAFILVGREIGDFGLPLFSIISNLFPLLTLFCCLLACLLLLGWISWAWMGDDEARE